MKKTKIDAHCHLFNKDILTIRIWLDIILKLESLNANRSNEKAGSLIKRIKDTIQSIKKILNFIKIGWRESSTDIYELLQGEYVSSQDEKFIVTPLTLDIKYAFEEPDRFFRNSLEQYEDEDDVLRDEVKRLVDELEMKVIALSDEARKDSHDKNSLLFNVKERNNYLETIKAVETLLTTHAELKTYSDRFLEAPDDITKAKQVLRRESSFEIQISEMLELKNNADYGEYVLPFFSVDPRRADTPQKAAAYLNEIKNSVGKNKSFVGIKLYCPLGYSPTDPFLFGSKDGDGSEDCLYKYCQDNKIPITAHCSDAGFATFAQYAKPTGYVFINENTADEELVYVENKMIDFGSSVLRAKDKSEAIRKRARILNHPIIWEKVYERYNNIYLNLAHFGGEDINGDWRPVIFDIIKTYPNAYTDFSCYSDANRLKEVKEQYYDPKSAPKEKFIYGSDYYLVMLSEIHFSSYINAFRKLFSDQEFENISIETPRTFMQHVLNAED
jgi:predicted TIM-barrel fold metal-dependent hydrolase